MNIEDHVNILEINAICLNSFRFLFSARWKIFYNEKIDYM